MPSPIVIKLGGALLSDAEGMDALWRGIAALQTDQPVVVVHGGGPQATAMARRLGHEPQIVHGRRVTTDLDLDILTGTVGGTINATLVGQAVRHGLRAVGLIGADGQVVRVRRRPPWTIDGESVDFGWVGDIDRIDTALLDLLLGEGWLPVVGPVGIDAEGQLYNVNADTLSQAIAVALGAERYLLVTEAGGVRRDPNDPTTGLTMCDRATFEAGIADGWIQGGMRVKLSVGLSAREAGIADVRIVAPTDLRDADAGTRLL